MAHFAFCRPFGEFDLGHQRPSVKAFGGVREVFEALAERGGKIALATECKGPELKHYLSVLHIDEFIAATACGDDVEHGKPDPRIVGMALRKLVLAGLRRS